MKKHQTSPEARKRGRWLAGLWGTKRPQYPRHEFRPTGPNGKLERHELPPLPRATRKEFFTPHGSV